MITTKTTTLQLEFVDPAGAAVTYALKDPKAGLDKAAVDAAAKIIIDNKVFATKGGDLASLKESRIVTRQVESIDA
ncbi:MAG: DUF2922 domain-containing protein [Megasphaera sp.]|jgi:hypothetical protein|nr:DUF2922 domain-containing protein [Megasphaera sp.]